MGAPTHRIPFFILFIVDCVSLSFDQREMLFQLVWLGNGITRPPGKAFVSKKEFQCFFRKVGQKDLPDGRAVRWISQADPGGHPKPALAVICFNLIDIDNFVSVEEDEMDGFFRLLLRGPSRRAPPLFAY